MRTSWFSWLMVAVACATGCEHAIPTAPKEARTAAMVTAQQDSARTLVDVVAGTVGTSNNWVGQSVTIPGHASYNRIRFNWYTYGATPIPTAFGTLYLLAAEYLGTPTQLNSSTNGFIAASDAIVDGQYVFDSKVRVKGGTKYWFYTDAFGAFATSFYGSSYAGGDMYITGMPNLPFHAAPGSGTVVDANFRLEVRVTD